MKTRRKALLAGGLAFFFAPSLEADVVSLKNGDRFTGQVKSLAGDKLVLGTEYAGDISIDWSVISSFSSAEKVQVDLASGELVTGEIELTEEDRFQVITEKETLALNRADVKEFGPIPQPENYRFIDNWHGGINFGLSVAKGNTDLSSLAISADPSRETSNDRISIFFSRVRSRDEGLPKADLYKVSGRYDRFLTENMFLYGAGAYDRDLESDLDYRLREGGGAGYRFKMADHTVLSALGGFSVAQEKFTLLDRSTEWLARIDHRWDLKRPPCLV